ncbi:CDGSH iron-sulfur domain-containing protein [Thalassotalea sp. HSM 43]|uniref:CDGSH iron-sulfur domain-containing protein n=1 Tax=Thalassotalea sp. HSM 43 TaxID=2552945 RepID=UPI001080C2C1|nr:CDGSH iron-sulfur domain-containing protein [Thalassotalea sp. HSM 43]QBY05131.1 CDGSH iron-sulfur domain-containing protein [Thalassotalea sp. HSM 43]
MSKPVIADNKPIKVELEKDSDYFFCTCGRSKSQPFCDGSHAGTSFKPQRYTAEQDGDQYFCQCKHSLNPPFCDGSHKQFNASDKGKEGPDVVAVD